MVALHDAAELWHLCLPFVQAIVGPLELELSRDKRLALPPPTAADAVDPRSSQPRHRLRFVEYLRHAFRWGGLAGLKTDRDAEGEYLLARLRRDLVDF